MIRNLKEVTEKVANLKPIIPGKPTTSAKHYQYIKLEEDFVLLAHDNALEVRNFRREICCPGFNVREHGVSKFGYRPNEKWRLSK